MHRIYQSTQETMNKGGRFDHSRIIAAKFINSKKEEQNVRNPAQQKRTSTTSSRRIEVWDIRQNSYALFSCGGLEFRKKHIIEG